MVQFARALQQAAPDVGGFLAAFSEACSAAEASNMVLGRRG